jgi:acetyl-CoA acyltransferase
MIENVVIVEAVRSAVGRAHKGTLALTRPDELAGQVIAALLGRVPQLKAAEVEETATAARCPRASRG